VNDVLDIQATLQEGFSLMYVEIPVPAVGPDLGHNAGNYNKQ
jgi:hypothetical protein